MLSSENGKVVELLQNIWGEMKTLNGRINTTNDRLDVMRTELRTEIADLRGEVVDLREEVSDLREDTRAGFEKVSLRIDNVLLGEHRREHAELRERLVRLETRFP